MPNVRPEFRNPASGKTRSALGLRIEALLHGRSQAWLAREAGISTGTLSEIMKGQMPGADKAIKLSQALEVTVEFLFGGENASGANPLVGFDEAEWVMAPRYRLADFAGGSKPDPVETIPIRKDWLSQAVRIKKNLWVTDLPSTTEGVGFEGDAILCRDAETHFQEGWYLYFYDGMPIVRRVIAPLPGQPLNDLAGSDAKLRLVARVLGTIKLRPI